MPEAHGSLLIPATSAAPRPRRRRVTHVSSAGLMLLAVFAFLLIGRAPEIFVFLLPLRPLLVTGLLVIAWAATVPRTPLPPFWSEPEVRLTLCLLGYAVATIPLSIWPSQSIEFVTGFVKTVVFMIVVVHCVRSPRHVTTIMWAVVAAAFLIQYAMLMGYGGLNVQTGAIVGAAEGRRASVTGTYDPNDIAFVMACVLPLAFFRAVSARGVARFLAGGVAFLCIVIASRTGSRGGFITMVVVAGILFVKARGNVRWIMTGLAVAGMLAFASGQYWDRIGTIWGAKSSDVSSYEVAGLDAARWQTWRKNTTLAIAYLPFGSGAGTNTTAEGHSHGGGGKWETAHNAFLQIAVEMGIPGVAIFVTLLYGATRSCRRLVRATSRRPELSKMTWMAHAVETSLYAYIVGALALSHAYAPILYLLLGLTACLRRIARRAQANA
jgi:putative inorganic carbon (HCO3(-)) transporter